MYTNTQKKEEKREERKGDLQVFSCGINGLGLLVIWGTIPNLEIEAA